MIPNRKNLRLHFSTRVNHKIQEMINIQLIGETGRKNELCSKKEPLH